MSEARLKHKRLYGLGAAWKDLTRMRKIIISLGGIAAAVIAISGAWAIGEKWIDAKRPWALRSVETVVAGLQIEADQRTLRDLDDRIFRIRYDLSKQPGSRFLNEELKRTQDQREKLQKKIDIQIQKGEK